MNKLRKKQLLKRANLQTQQFPIIQNNHEDYVYRLYLPQSQFAKEVDFRVSLETYYITQYSSSSVTLRNYDDPNKTKITTWQSLVLVKKPFPDAPNCNQLKKIIKKKKKKMLLKWFQLILLNHMIFHKLLQMQLVKIMLHYKHTLDDYYDDPKE